MISQIADAFSSVRREEGISLHEAHVIDRYGTKQQRSEARKLDTDKHWNEVPDAQIEKSTSVLCFLDPIGWRYYIPAYMKWTLKYFKASRSFTCDSTIYSFNSSVERKEIEQLPKPSKQQRFMWSYVIFQPFLNFIIRRIDAALRKVPVNPDEVRARHLERFRVLTEEQSRCVYGFLKYMIDYGNGYVDHQVAQIAIDSYWIKFGQRF